MYKMLSALYEHQTELIGLIDDFISALKSEEEFSQNDISSESLFEKLQKIRSVDLFILVESIHLASNKPIDQIVAELEENYSEIIQELAALKCYIEDNSEHIDGDIYSLFVLIQEIVAQGIVGMNKMASRYFNKPADDLYSFDEYFAIARGQYVYGRRLEGLYSNQSEVSEEDLSRWVFDISERKTWEEMASLNYDDFTPDEIGVIQENSETIKSEIFQVSFLSKRMEISSKKELSDEQINTLFKYLKEHRILINTTRRAFKKVITSQMGKKQIIWYGAKTDAHRFRILCDWSYKDFNDRFIIYDGKKLDKGNLPKEGFNSDFKVFCDELAGIKSFSPMKFR